MNEESKKITIENSTIENINDFVGDGIICHSCKLEFGIIKNYIGIINCPYCNEYVEGM